MFSFSEDITRIPPEVFRVDLRKALDNQITDEELLELDSFLEDACEEHVEGHENQSL